MGMLTKLNECKSRIIEHKFRGCWTLIETILHLICLVDAWHSNNSWAVVWWNVYVPWSSWWGMTRWFYSSHIRLVESSLEWMISTLKIQSQTLIIPLRKTPQRCDQGSCEHCSLWSNPKVAYNLPWLNLRGSVLVIVEPPPTSEKQTEL
jgi:hypothetical protein